MYQLPLFFQYTLKHIEGAFPLDLACKEENEYAGLRPILLENLDL